jgi:hypothetical protein
MRGLWHARFPPTTRGAGGTQHLEGLKVHRKFDFLAFVQRFIAKFGGTRRLPLWQRALAVSTGLTLLVSLLWVMPWHRRPDRSATIPQTMPVQGSDHTAEETAQPTLPPPASPTEISAVSSQLPEIGIAPGEDAHQSPVLQDHPPALSEESAEVLDAQAMQDLVTRLDATRSTPSEHLDIKAMGNLLASLESSDKTTSPTAPRSKGARKKGAKSLPRTAPGRRTPGSTPPPQSNPMPLRAALAFQFPDTPKPVWDSLP